MPNQKRPDWDYWTYDGVQYSCPSHLRRRMKRLWRFSTVSSFSTMALIVVFGLTPDALWLEAAKFLTEHFWIHIKPVSLEACVVNCARIAYALVAVPVALAVALLSMPRSVHLALDNAKAVEEAVEAGAALNGMQPDGRPRPFATPWKRLLAFLGVLVLCGILVGVCFLISLVAGDAQILKGRFGGHLPFPLAEIQTTFMLCAVQFIMAFVTFLTINGIVAVRDLGRLVIGGGK